MPLLLSVAVQKKAGLETKPIWRAHGITLMGAGSGTSSVMAASLAKPPFVTTVSSESPLCGKRPLRLGISINTRCFLGAAFVGMEASGARFLEDALLAVVAMAFSLSMAVVVVGVLVQWF